MEPRQVFTCQNCDAEMEVDDPRVRDRIGCRRCGRLYRLDFSEAEQAWVLRAEEPVEPEKEERRREEPFSVLEEVGRPKRVDRSEEHREQTDTHSDEDVAKEKAGRKS